MTGIWHAKGDITEMTSVVGADGRSIAVKCPRCGALEKDTIRFIPGTAMVCQDHFHCQGEPRY